MLFVLHYLIVLEKMFNLSMRVAFYIIYLMFLEAYLPESHFIHSIPKSQSPLNYKKEYDKDFLKTLHSLWGADLQKI